MSFEQFDKLLADAQRQAPDLHEVLLPGQSTYVLAELERKTKTELVPLGSSTIDQHYKAFQQTGMRWGAADAPQSAKSSPWWKALSGRERDIIIYLRHQSQREGHT